MAIGYVSNVQGVCLSGSGSIGITFTSGVEPFSVNWTTPNLGIDSMIYTGMTSERTSLSPGLYQIIISDSSVPNNEQITLSFPISDSNCSSILDSKNTTCGENNGSVTATTSSLFYPVDYFLYNQSNHLVYSASIQSEYFIYESLSADTYQIISIDFGGCTGFSETFVIEESEPLDYGFYVVDDSSCNIMPTGRIFVTGQTGVSPYSYKWTNGSNTDSITGLSAGSYAVTITDANGCSLTKSVTISRVEPMFILSTTATQPTCLSSDGVLNILFSGGTPPFYYSASTGDIQISYSRNYSLNNLAGGLYYIQITDAAFCKTTTLDFLISPSGMSQVDVTTTNSSCSNTDGKINVNVIGGTGPYTYTLIYPDSTTKTNTTLLQNNLFSGLYNGTYNLTVQDSSGCTFNSSYTIITENKFTFTATTESTDLGKNVGKIIVNKSTGGTEPFIYILDDETSIIETSFSSVTFNNVSGGQHLIKVKDSLGCVKSDFVFVDTMIPIDFYLEPNSVRNYNDGSIRVFITDGVPPFNFVWSDNVIGNPQDILVTGLTAGTYNVTITDSKNTSKKREIILSGTKRIVSYSVYGMGENEVTKNLNSKYDMSKMLNDGFYELTSGHTDCKLTSADFTAKVNVRPLNLSTTKTFYTTYSLTDSPDDNLWLDSAVELLTSVQGVSRVKVDEFTNKFIVEGNLSDQSIILGDNKIYLELSLLINYDINCGQ